jgi:cytochrome P450
MMAEHKKVHTVGSKDDYINAYYTERAEREKTGAKPEFFCDDALESALNLMFFAGTDTTATTLRWGFLFMILHPDVQVKVQKELDDVIGRERTPSCDDRVNLPYTEATLLEIQRRGSVVPLSIPHMTLEETHLNGYRIPKNTGIFPNIFAVHHEEKLFPDPFAFRPERFINEKGQTVKPEYIIPFSIGKRSCPGEPLARMELFLYFTSVLHKFTLKAPEGVTLSTEAVSTVVRVPKPYDLVAVPRSN